MCKLFIKIRRFSLPVFLLLFLCSNPALSDMGSGGRNAPEQLHKPYLVLISNDGFRWDYPDLYPTPAIARIAKRGIKAEAMQPALPTLTFPNHYSIATGMLPAAYFFVGTEAIVLVSDHGQALYQQQNPVFILDQHVVLDGARLVEGGPWVFIHFDKRDDTRAMRLPFSSFNIEANIWVPLNPQLSC